MRRNNTAALQQNGAVARDCCCYCGLTIPIHTQTTALLLVRPLYVCVCGMCGGTVQRCVYVCVRACVCGGGEGGSSLPVRECF